MKLVQPIRDKDIVERMKLELKKQCYRDYMLFFIGINTGLRIGDILKLKAGQVKTKNYVNIIEEKTNKPKRIKFNESVLLELREYAFSFQDEEYLFQSRKGKNKPISRVQAYRLLNIAASKIGLEEIGTHSLRKTFGYWHYKKYNDIAMLQGILNHSAPSVTLLYIGITQDAIDKSYQDFIL